MSTKRAGTRFESRHYLHDWLLAAASGVLKATLADDSGLGPSDDATLAQRVSAVL